MTSWPNQTTKEMNAFYGNPDVNGDFKADSAWENTNIVKIIPPYKMYYPQEVGGKLIKRGTEFKSLRVHKKCAASLEKILKRIGTSFTPQELMDYELDLCGGVNNFRLMRGGTRLSIHSWGAAIDLSHLINSWKKKYDSNPAKKMMPLKAVEMFKDEGWTWGGYWSTPDAMHFQAADVK